MWKTVCDKVVCESWYVTKCAWKMVCDRWCVTKMCVSMWKTVCDKVVCVKVGIDKFQSVCERSSVTDGVWQRCASENCWQRLYDRWCVSKVCVKDGVWLAGVWQRCVWDGLWNQGGCHICEIVPRLPCETKVDDRRCHQVPRLPRKVPRRHARPKRAQARHPGPWVPRLPRKTKVDVRLCHACHAKRPWMWDCATPATWNQGGCHQVPRLPRKVPRCHARPSGPKRATQCHECHACHAKRRWMWDCATPATWNQGGCHQVPRLPRKVPRRHARPSGPKRATQCYECHACHAKRPWMWDCATPATWNQGGCHQVPRLPRKVPRRHARPSGPKRATQCHECHACHAKRPWMWDCATPATQNDRGCEIVPRLPRGTKVNVTKCLPTQNDRGCEIVPRLPRGTKVDVTKCHACHAKCRGVTRDQAGPSAPPSAMSATPATQNEGGCEIAPRLPRETKVDVTKCHASHAKCRGVIRDSRLPRETKVDFTKCHACHAKMVCDRLYVTKLCVKLCMWQMVCDKVVC